MKYPGGKRLEIKHFASLIPTFDTYYEPFLGGGAVFFYLAPRKAVINDLNPNLIRFYKGVQDNYVMLSRELQEIYACWLSNKAEFIVSSENRSEDPNERFYYQLRAMFNQEISSSYSYATLYYALNKLSFSAVRYNSKGKMNVPYGHRLSFSQTLKQEHHELLQGTHIQNSDYTALFHQATSKDFLFLDPPYDTCFTQYGNVVDFKEEEQRRLAENFKNLSTKALMIVGKTPLIESLYGSYIYGSYEKRYAQNFSKQGRGTSTHVTHLIVSNYL